MLCHTVKAYVCTTYCKKGARWCLYCWIHTYKLDTCRQDKNVQPAIKKRSNIKDHFMAQFLKHCTNDALFYWVKTLLISIKRSELFKTSNLFLFTYRESYSIKGYSHRASTVLHNPCQQTPCILNCCKTIQEK